MLRWLTCLIYCLLFSTIGLAQFSVLPLRDDSAPRPAVKPDGVFITGVDNVQLPVVKSPLSGSAEVGLNGSDGNTDVMKIRLGGDLKYEVPQDIFAMNFFYGRTKQNGIKNENKALWNARNEILFGDSPWSWFQSFQWEYDEFRNFDMRVALHTGGSFQAIKTSLDDLKFRIGAGTSREVGGAKDQWIPEGILGFDFEHKFSDRQKFVTNFDYFPDLSDWTRYRIRARGFYEILCDPATGLTIRVGAQDRFDSKPGTSKKNDLDYFVTLLIKF